MVGADLMQSFHIQSCFFFYLTHERDLVSFTFLHASTRKVPSFAVHTFGQQECLALRDESEDAASFGHG